MILYQHDLILRPITGPDELDLFNSLPYVLNEEVGGDLAAGRRRPERLRLGAGCRSPRSWSGSGRRWCWTSSR